MRNRARKFDVAHALTAHFSHGHFNSALLANNTAMLETLVFAAQTFVVFDRTKNLRAKQTIALRLERPVVDGLWFTNFTVRPRADLFGRRDTNLNGIELFVLGDLLK